MVQATREKLQRFLNAPRADEIVIGANTTTNNFALSRRARAQSRSQAGRRDRPDAHGSRRQRFAVAANRRGSRLGRALGGHHSSRNASLDLNSLEAALTERTKIVATVHASNAVGTINPVAQIAQMAHAAGALYVVDAVQSAPHIPIDVQAIGCDFLLCSSYKFFGPHQGIMWGRYDLLASLPAYKVRPAHDEPPDRWETGTPAFELIAGVGAAVDYLDSLGGTAALIPYERELVAHLIEVLQGFDDVTISGITDPARYARRVPTVVFSHARYTPTAGRGAAGGREHLRLGWQLLRGRDHAAAEQAGWHGASRLGALQHSRRDRPLRGGDAEAMSSHEAKPSTAMPSRQPTQLGADQFEQHDLLLRDRARLIVTGGDHPVAAGAADRDADDRAQPSPLDQRMVRVVGGRGDAALPGFGDPADQVGLGWRCAARPPESPPDLPAP